MNNLAQKACKILKNFKLLNTAPGHPGQGRSTQRKISLMNTIREQTKSKGIAETGTHTSCMVVTEPRS
ncbi:MAG: hypothetical protein M0O96_05465 [Desulforhopalus sp.]|nr:hypothetical protein [Desulforhopalus sp.]